MNKEHLRQWIEALRSGKYQQTKARLKNGEDHFCCLGVLCDISQTGRWSACLEYVTGGDGVFHARSDYPTTAVEEWLETRCSNVRVSTAYVLEKLGEEELTKDALEKPFLSLSELNDEGASFRVIADILEDILTGKLVSGEDSACYKPCTKTD